MRSKVLLSHMVGLLYAVPLCAWAALGGNVASVTADGVHIKAAVRIKTTNDQYTVHEMQAPSGTLVREYVAPDGTVFGVAWKGPVMPDLRQLLGTYFAPYAEAAAEKHAGHGHLLVQQQGLIVHSGGHMRAFSGSAYVPDLLPSGVAVDDIQ